MRLANRRPWFLQYEDETRYRGTCYKACGFTALGATAAFARSTRDFYTEHSQPKQLFERALHPRGRALSRQARLLESLALHEAVVAGPCPLQAPALGPRITPTKSSENVR